LSSDVPVFKVGQRTFQIGKFDNFLSDNIFLSNIISLIDRGLKFIPNLFLNEIALFKFILLSFDENFNKFNSKLKLVEKRFLRDDIDIHTDFSQPSLDVISAPTFFDTFSVKHKKCANKFNNLYFNINQESTNFRFNFYKSLSDVSKIDNLNINIDSNETKYLLEYKKRKPFKIIDCDKNVGLCIISNSDYNRYALQQLEVVDNFELLLEDPLINTINIIESTLLTLYKSKNLNKKIYSKLIPNANSCKSGNFRLLAKLHKEKLSFRPIINSIAHPTSSLSLLIDCILQPLVKNNSSYIQDSQNLIQITRNRKFPVNSKLYSCDFEGLYSNIDLKHALIVISEYVLNNFESELITPVAFNTILKLVFENNIFKFNKKHYKQIKGIAMGSKSGPSIANIYIWILEKNFLSLYDPFLYVRFIDDIFIIVEEFFNIDTLVKTFTYLKLNIVTSDVVIFLDLEITLDKFTRELNFSLFIKPTCTFSYLLSSSNHPDFIFDNIPLSLLIRYKRINTFLHKFLYFAIQLVKQLVSRGYDYTVVMKSFLRIAYTERDTLIDYKDKNRNNIDTNKGLKSIFFNFPFDSNINSLAINKSFNTASNELSSNKAYSNHKLRVINHMQKNFSLLFVHSSPIVCCPDFGYKKCYNNRCKICTNSNNASFIRLNDFFLPMLCYSSCSTLNAIYIIKCNNCFSFYVGQTESIKTRLNTHFRGCFLNSPSLATNTTCVTEHFNNGYCSLLNFSFFIFRSNIVNKYHRLNVETLLIHLFLDLGIKLINDKIPDKYYWNRRFTKLFEI